MILSLCGMMGVGKTTVGIELAKKTSLLWFDTDKVIEDKYGKISDIFAKSGEDFFRDLETETVKNLCQQNGCILSLGGGLVLRKENVDTLKKVGKIVYLRAKKETLVQRLRFDNTRPLLQGEDIETRVQKLIRQRATIYENVADYVIDVDNKTVQEIANEILALTDIK